MRVRVRVRVRVMVRVRVRVGVRVRLGTLTFTHNFESNGDPLISCASIRNKREYYFASVRYVCVACCERKK
jgi:hypothetical protein